MGLRHFGIIDLCLILVFFIYVISVHQKTVANQFGEQSVSSSLFWIPSMNSTSMHHCHTRRMMPSLCYGCSRMIECSSPVNSSRNHEKRTKLLPPSFSMEKDSILGASEGGIGKPAVTSSTSVTTKMVSEVAQMNSVSFTPLNDSEYRISAKMYQQLRYDFTYFFSQACMNHTIPQILDAVVYEKGQQLEIYVIYNPMNVLQQYTPLFQHRNISLLHNGNTYYNQINITDWNTRDAIVFMYRLSKNDALFSLEGRDRRMISFIIHNSVQDLSYSLSVPVVEVKVGPLWKFVLVAYVSRINTVEEVLRWIAYHKIRKVDHIELYLADRVPDIEKALKKLIESGYVSLSYWYYPKNPYYVTFAVPQRTNQIASYLSAVYRYKYLSQFLCSIDMDEYIVSKDVHADIVSVIYSLFNSNAPLNSLILSMYLFTSSTEGIVNRDTRSQLMKSHSFYNRFRYRNEHYPKTGSKHIIKLDMFEAPANMHYCKCNSTFAYYSDNVLFLAHYKLRAAPELPLFPDDSVSFFESQIEQMVVSFS